MMNRRTALIALPIVALAPLALLPSRKSPAPALHPVATGLAHPWGMAFLPDGSLLLTERPGRLRRVTFPDGKLGPAIAGTPVVDAEGQGGLLGIAIDPDFSTNRQVYMSFSERREGGNATAVFRAKLNADFSALEAGKVIFRQNQAIESEQHFGSRLVFDRVGNLFVTTGERGSHAIEAQNPASHLGKVLRITAEGSPAPGNPNLPDWAPEVWSIGHRNIQGATLHPETGELWTIEHGAKGGDEINTPKAGRNYGWPIITFGKNYNGAKIGEGTVKAGMEQPLHYWDPSIAPSGLTFYTGNLYANWKGSLFAGALAGSHIARLKVTGNTVVAEEKLFDGFARFRDIVQGPTGHLFVLTDEDEPDGGLYKILSDDELIASDKQLTQ